jgi:hypothetical protein
VSAAVNINSILAMIEQLVLPLTEMHVPNFLWPRFKYKKAAYISPRSRRSLCLNKRSEEQNRSGELYTHENCKSDIIWQRRCWKSNQRNEKRRTTALVYIHIRDTYIKLVQNKNTAEQTPLPRLVGLILF